MAQVEKIHAHSVWVSEVETYTDINKVYDSYNFVVDMPYQENRFIHKIVLYNSSYSTLKHITKIPNGCDLYATH